MFTALLSSDSVIADRPTVETVPARPAGNGPCRRLSNAGYFEGGTTWVREVLAVTGEAVGLVVLFALLGIGIAGTQTLISSLGG